MNKLTEEIMRRYGLSAEEAISVEKLQSVLIDAQKLLRKVLDTSDEYVRLSQNQALEIETLKLAAKQ